MSLTVKSNGEFELAPEGTHPARCWLVADLGMHDSGMYGLKPKIKISWELPGELMKDGRPFSVSSRYTASLNKNAPLRRDLESWRGRAFTDQELAGFDISNVLGKPCLIQVQHKKSADGSKTYDNVVAVMACPKGLTVPELVNQPIQFDCDRPENFSKLPDWLQRQINLPGRSAAAAGQPPPHGDDEIPGFDDDSDVLPF